MCIVFNRGEGKDTIINKDAVTANNILRMGEGIQASEIKLERSENNNLTLRLGASSDAVILQDYFWQATENDSLGNPTAMTGKIDTVEFFDGTVWTPTQIEKNGFNHC
jgi:hypothetical protein